MFSGVKSVGTPHALAAGMDSAKKFEDLIVWQLAVKLRDRVYEMTEKGPVLGDKRFLDQIRDSSASVPSNISEGFVRFEPHEFAPYMKTAKASLGETQNPRPNARVFLRGRLHGSLASRLSNLSRRQPAARIFASMRKAKTVRTTKAGEQEETPDNATAEEPRGTEPGGTEPGGTEPRGTEPREP
jgi:hypothetical protein